MKNPARYIVCYFIYISYIILMRTFFFSFSTRDEFEEENDDFATFQSSSIEDACDQLLNHCAANGVEL